jgi:hypothetical protein
MVFIKNFLLTSLFSKKQHVKVIYITIPIDNVVLINGQK